MPGPFYFAWVDATDNVWSPTFLREDEEIFSFTVEHSEGDFAALQMTIRNPRIGPLAPGRKVWAWLAWDNGSEIIPLFFGRLISVPSDIHAELVQFEFSARPSDYTSQKQMLAEILRVAPYYDPIWIDEQRRVEPDVVLEARPELWHIDRITHMLTTSNVLTGEDGVYDFPVNEVFYDSLKVSLNSVPLRSVDVDAKITWTQAATGQVDVGAMIHYFWPNPGTPTYHLLQTFSGDGLLAAWPKAEQGVGGGWTVASGSCVAKQGLAVPNEFEALETINGVLVPKSVPPNSIVIPTVKSLVLYAWFLESIVVPMWHMKGELIVRYDVKRGRSERIRFKLSTDMQAIATLPGDDEALLLNLNSVDVGMPIDSLNPLSEIPLDDLRARSFLPRARGQQALQYLISLARANLMIRSRAVECEFECEFENAIELSCRMNGLIHDPRLPGGQATGKIIAYSFGLDGDAGGPFGKVTLGCPVGYGNAIVTNVGEPLYIEDGYIEPGYYERDGEIIAIGAGDVGYTVPADNPNDDGIDFIRGFNARTVVKHVGIINGPIIQGDAINAYRNQPNVVIDEAGVKEVLQKVPTKVRIEFLPLTGGPFETEYIVAVTKLVIPQGINLEAPSTP